MEEKIYNLALRFLSFRPRSEKEVRNRLKIKNQNLKIKNFQIIEDQVIQKLKNQKFINDEEFARLWVESRLRSKPRSLKLIKIELKQKGISDEIISNSKFLISNDRDSARTLIGKRIKRYKSLPKDKIYEKLGRYLASKGFGWDVIKQSIDEVLEKGV